MPATDTLEIQGPSLTVLKASTVFSDPFNGQVNPKRIPGALVTYTIQVTNTGSGAVDNNTTVFVDPIPADVSLVLADFAGAGSGPVGFTQGADPSGLTYTFTSLASAADDIGFFSDAACTALITPTADANGVDSAVRCVRVNPKGVFLGDSIAGLPPSPGFSISFRARIK